jgi:hypothetical protein
MQYYIRYRKQMEPEKKPHDRQEKLEDGRRERI